MKNTLILLLSLLFSSTAFGVTLKVAILAPEGSTWADNLKTFSKDVKKKTNGKVKFKVYYGGVAGDEPDVLRKIRVRQMHGGIFTGRALGDISGDIRAMEVPFKFHGDRKSAWKKLQDNSKFFNQGFEKNGFKNLGFFEIGLVYVASTKPAKSLDEMKGLKVWSWEGDKLVSTMVDTMGLVSVPLALPDVLSSLSTGTIDAVYGSPMAFIAVQWHKKIKYLVNFPVSYSVAAFLVDNKQWNKLSAEHKKIVEDLAAAQFKKANLATVKENEEALGILKQMGVEFIDFPDADKKEGTKIRKEIIAKLQGKLFSEKAIEKVGK